jgi:hypothetical protein
MPTLSQVADILAHFITSVNPPRIPILFRALIRAGWCTATQLKLLAPHIDQTIHDPPEWNYLIGEYELPRP